MFAFQKGSGNTWYFPGIQVGDSSVLCWPLIERMVPGCNDKYCKFADCAAPTTISIVQLNNNQWKGKMVAFRSWFWQWDHYSFARDRWQPAVRLFSEGEVMTVQKLAASQAFFKLSKSELTDFAQHLGIDVEKGADLFTTILTMVKSLLECSD